MWTRRAFEAAVLGGLGAVLMGEEAEAARLRTRLTPFVTSPFPYDGLVPDSGRPFLDTQQGAQRGHTSPRGGVYLEDPTYEDQRVLLAYPVRFRTSRPALVVFLHGNLAELDRDVVHRQRIVAQFAASGLDGVLVAPQFARDALDSSAGHFWDAGGFARFLAEAADRLAGATGVPSSHFQSMPVVLVAYSGGYHPAAAILTYGEVNDRLAGIVLMDALYGEEQAFADWLVRSNGAVFLFSAFSKSSAANNMALQAELRARGIAMTEGLPGHVRAGTVAFLQTGPLVVHNDFMTEAWTRDPLRAVLARVRV